jgi:lipopolysaccharide transport system ATP-binding protein
MLSETLANDANRSSELPRNLNEDEIAISARNLGKCYAIYNTPKDKLKEVLCFGRRNYHRDFWALRDISFDIKRGETVGIIGRNGSGKSTLLQILCGTLAPTVGTVEIRGQVSALLELGSGFNPEFTGKENVYMNAAILGLSKEEIDSKYQSIVDFADIGDFVDQPVKKYSSGMYVRLAFATAINVDPDVLVVDEVLAVGDALFQNKCYRKFREFQSLGKTVLFVTHSTDLVVKHCRRGMVVSEGSLHYCGKAKDAVNVYLDSLFGTKTGSRQSKASLVEKLTKRERFHRASLPRVAGKSDKIELFLEDRATEDNFANRSSYNPNEYRYGDGRAFLVDYLLAAGQELDIDACDCDTRLDLYVKINFAESVDGTILGLTLQTIDGVNVYGHNSRDSGTRIPRQSKGSVLVAKFSFVPRLIAGTYFISLGIAQENEAGIAMSLDRRYSAIALRVNNGARAFGLADLRMTLEVGL